MACCIVISAMISFGYLLPFNNVFLTFGSFIKIKSLIVPVDPFILGFIPKEGKLNPFLILSYVKLMMQFCGKGMNIFINSDILGFLQDLIYFHINLLSVTKIHWSSPIIKMEINNQFNILLKKTMKKHYRTIFIYNETCIYLAVICMVTQKIGHYFLNTNFYFLLFSYIRHFHILDSI